MKPQRSGDQPAPIPNDGLSMHDLVADDLARTHSTAPTVDLVRRDLAERKAIGLERYGSLLQAGNGRDALRDLYEELQDAAVYARQKVEESLNAGHMRPALNGVYRSILRQLLTVRALIAAEEVTPS